ncbi:MAG: DUF3108 domain-containing protein [Candidatus Cloacimonetes bacterium]|nr:DUF3108 domain-containing protein [Candidatus Cloacimonadota bacterium]
MKKILIFLSLIIFCQLSAYEIGEELTFKLSYSFINAGSSTIKINKTTYKDTISCLQIYSESRTNDFFDKIFKVRDKIESIWDKNQNHSYRFSKNLQEGKYRQRRIHYYYPQQNLTIYLKKDKKATDFKEKHFAIPANTHDILSAFYWLREQKLTVGDTLSINITVDGKSYLADLKILRTEKINSIFGEKECFVIEPMLQSEAIFKQTGKIHIWISNDNHQIPLKIESKIVFGSFQAILKEVKNVTYKKK